MTQTENRVAIVTGSSRGIGRAIAERLATDGFAVAVNYAGNKAKAEEAVATIIAAGGKAVAIEGDVSKEADVAKIYEGTRDAFGRVDAVVNNAGIMSLAAIAEGKNEEFDRIIAINLRGMYLMMWQAAKHLDRGGRFIAISTSVIGRNLPTYGAYIASKSGVEGLVRVFANELRGRNITVNAIAPGPVGTELFLNGKSDELIAQFVKGPPLERLGKPTDIAKAVSFLAGPDGEWVNGQILRVNGGLN
jgi:3-oxoacyl-[acyl-carrier protein] reductase